MHWIGLALLALVVGWLQAKIAPKILSSIPTSATKSTWAVVFFNGAVIIIVVFIAAFALSLVGLRPKGA
jgi:hypothetical protein